MILQSIPEMSQGYFWYTFSITPGFRYQPRPDALIWYVIKDGNEFALIRSSLPVNVEVSEENVVKGLRGRRYTGV